MKYKFLKLSTLLILTGLLSTVATAANESEQSVGMCLGHVYSTDIVTYVDGMPITSYNIGGKTVIAAKDLMEYGLERGRPHSIYYIGQVSGTEASAPTCSRYSRAHIGKYLPK